MLFVIPPLRGGRCRLDTETMAIEPQSAGVIEIAAVVIRDGAVRQDEAFSCSIDPQERILTSAHGGAWIRDRDIAVAPFFATVSWSCRFHRRKPYSGTRRFDLSCGSGNASSSILFPVWAALGP